MKNSLVVYEENTKDECYASKDIIFAAKRVLDGDRFELDPASCEAANKVVEAEEFYTRQDNGLSPKYNWDVERLWLYPPDTNLQKWVRKWITVGRRRVCKHHWFLLTPNDTGTPWAQSLLDRRSLSKCFVGGGGVKFWGPNMREGNNIMNPVIWYWGSNHAGFRHAFCELGAVVMRTFP